MKKIDRRKFLLGSVKASAGLAVFPYWQRSVWSQVNGANGDIRIGVAGLHSRGGSHAQEFDALNGVRVVALCDPDKQVLEEYSNVLAEARVKGNRTACKIDTYADYREMLDNKDIDAVVIAAPNHWHSLMTIWACQAGKHVYVEKPVSHSIWEGRKMVEAARKYNRVVQAGTQQRSCPAVIEAAADIQSGKYGKPLWVHTSVLHSRNPIGKVTEPQQVPDHIDYNLWAGPAPMSPVMRQSFHYDWHWQWNWGDGEMGNWGPHYVDDMRHMLGLKSVPTSVIAAGNRFVWDDNGQTPNMQFALFDYDGLKIVVDIRNLPDPSRSGGKSGAIYLKTRDGNHIQFADSYIHLARGGGGVYDLNGKRIKQYAGDAGAAHIPNFIEAVRKASPDSLNAEIEVGHLSTAMCHIANIGFKAGRNATVEQTRESLKEHPDAIDTIKDMLEQLGGNDVDLEKTPFMLGEKFQFDRKTEQFVGANADAANKYLMCSYRWPFVVPAKV